MMPLTYKKRERILVILDATGKWSLIDGIVCILMMVSFRFKLEVKILGFEPEFNIIVNPGWAFYGYILATIISLALTHFIIHEHRKDQEVELKNDTEKVALGRFAC